jgi:two-component system, chemotaxis family, sensor kinase Cph1
VIENLKLGDHVAFFFKTNEERLAHAIPYMIRGLEKNERCLYVADENTVFEILVKFHHAGLDVRAAQRRGALAVLTKRETYLRHGPFEPEKMIADLHGEVKYSLEHSFCGFRVSGEMSWALDLPSAHGRLIEYEEKLQKLWPAEFGAVCQYNETLFSPEIVEKMISLHPVVLRGGKIIRRDSWGVPETAGVEAGASVLHR